MATSTRAQRLKRRWDAWKKHTEGGKTQTQIAEEFGVNQATISRDLDWCSKLVIPDLKEHIVRVKVEQVETLRYLVSEMLAQWEASKGTKKVVTRVQKGERIKDPETGAVLHEPVVIITQNETELLGDIKYTQEARASMADIRRILGADAPLLMAQSVDISGSPIQVREVIVEVPSTFVKPGEDEVN